MPRKFDPMHTRRLLLAPFSRDDLTERYVSWLNDPETVRYSELRHTRHSFESCRAYMDAIESSGGWFIAMKRREENPDHIGNLSVVFDRSNKVADMAVLIGEKTVRGRGFAREAWCAVMELILSDRVADKVKAGTMSVNEPMIELAKASGMTLEAVIPGEFLFEGRRVDRLQFARFAE
ncbi:MAG: GNAT family N-acetyltransferase [Hyphomicrobiales bacterium]